MIPIPPNELEKSKTLTLLSSLLPQPSIRLCKLFALAILVQLLVLLLISLGQPRKHPENRPSPDRNCKSGTVYVYEMPPMFNKDLLADCENLDPWASKCEAVSNNGYGPRAPELARLVPANLAPTMYWSEYYMGEIMYHNRMLSYPCRTHDPDSATAFYVPFYAGIAVGKYLFGNHTAKERDWHGEMMLRWVRDQAYWRRSNGSDHIIMLGRLTWDFRRLTDSEWGSSFLYMPDMKNVIKLSAERHEWDEFEVSVPYPTSFHPRSDSDVTEWQHFVRRRKRSSLFCFVGATRRKIRNDFRGLLTEQCQSEAESCRFVDCSKVRCVDGTSAILESFLGSDFCLQPKGDGYTRRSVFDCLVAGSIPVFFWKQTAYEQYEKEWFLPGDPMSYSVFIDHDDIRNGTSVKGVLEKYSKEEIRKMRGKVIEYMPRFLYGKQSDDQMVSRDAFDIAVEGVLSKFRGHMKRQRDHRRA